MIAKNNIAIRIAGKVSRYIDESMNRATPSGDRSEPVRSAAGKWTAIPLDPDSYTPVRSAAGKWTTIPLDPVRSR